MRKHALNGKVGLSRICRSEHGGHAGAAGAGDATACRGEGDWHQELETGVSFSCRPKPMCTTMRRAKRCGWLVLKLWNESRTNRGRIADSQPVGIRSRLHLGMATHSHTIGGAAAAASAAKWLRSRC